MKQPTDIPHHTPASKKAKYRVRNWKEYNQALVARGSLTLWIPEHVQELWYGSGKETYSDAAIEIMLLLKERFALRLRPTEGFARSVFQLAGIALEIPDYSTLSRRAGTLALSLKKHAKERIDIILDSTGAKVLGEGEWKVRQHGKGKRRAWTKIHIGIDTDGEIRAVVTTGNNVHDSSVATDLLDQESARINHVYADGAYDAFDVYQALLSRGVTGFHIPPQRNAKIKVHGNSKGPPYPRDENLRAIRRSSRKRWKIASGYHARSKVETTMFRYKTTFGDHMHFRKKENQRTEVVLKCTILNTFHALGMPESYRVT